MDPDVFVTIAFCSYAVVVALGIGAVLRGTGAQHDTDTSDDARSSTTAISPTTREPN
jgi:hypothetical protein